MGVDLVTGSAPRPSSRSAGRVCSAADAERPSLVALAVLLGSRPDRDRDRLLGGAGAVAARASSPGTRPARATTTRSTASRRSSSGSPASSSPGSADRPEGAPRGRVILAALISYPRAIVLGLLQGVSELFPISSLGHTRDPAAASSAGTSTRTTTYFLTFLVATHLATAIVLFLFFWRDWVRILKGLGRSLRDRGIDADRRRREARLAARRRDDPGRDPRPAAAGHAAQGRSPRRRSAAVFLIAERRAALRRRAAPPARAADGRGRRRADRAQVSAGATRSSSARRRRSR